MCDALRRRGVELGTPAAIPTGSPAAFTVTVDRLGATFTLLVTYEAPLGTTRRALWAPVSDLRESDRIVERIATELTTGVKPALYAPRATIPSVLPQRKPRKPPDRPKAIQWYLGLESGLVAFPMASRGGGLFGAFLSIEAGHFGVSLRGFVAGGGGTTRMSGVALGGRYYFSRESTSLFFGGGIEKLSIEGEGGSDTLTDKRPCIFFCFGSDPYYTPGKLEGDSAGAFAETGFMFRRRRKIPLALFLRASFPFHWMTRTTPSTFDPNTETLTRSGPTRRYEVPLSLIFSVGF